MKKDDAYVLYSLICHLGDRSFIYCMYAPNIQTPQQFREYLSALLLIAIIQEKKTKRERKEDEPVSRLCHIEIKNKKIRKSCETFSGKKTNKTFNL
jgi:hypothetical protein